MVQEDTARVSAIVPEGLKESAFRKLEHGEFSRHVRDLLRDIANHDAPEQFDPNGYPEDWETVRKHAIIRDEFTCRNCGQQGNLYGPKELRVHHIVPLLKGGENRLSNLATLCKDCHDRA